MIKKIWLTWWLTFSLDEIVCIFLSSETLENLACVAFFLEKHFTAPWTFRDKCAILAGSFFVNHSKSFVYIKVDHHPLEIHLGPKQEAHCLKIIFKAQVSQYCNKMINYTHKVCLFLILHCWDLSQQNKVNLIHTHSKSVYIFIWYVVGIDPNSVINIMHIKWSITHTKCVYF